MAARELRHGVRVTLAGMAVNLLLAAVKMAAGVVGHSHALIADAVESLGDLLSSAVVWRGLVVAGTPPDEDHPYGHGKAEPLAAAVVAWMLLLAALWIAVGSARAILSPHEAPAAFTLWVLLGVIGVKELLFRWALRTGDALESSAIRADAWHHRSDALTSVAAAVGIACARSGGPGWEAADDWAALFAAGVIGWNGWRLLQPALSELMDAAPGPEIERRVRELSAGVEGVRRVEKCYVRKMGLDYFVDLHVEVDGDLPVREAHLIAHRVKDGVRAGLSTVRDVLVHVEPDRG